MADYSMIIDILTRYNATGINKLNKDMKDAVDSVTNLQRVMSSASKLGEFKNYIDNAGISVSKSGKAAKITAGDLAKASKYYADADQAFVDTVAEMSNELDMEDIAIQSVMEGWNKAITPANKIKASMEKIQNISFRTRMNFLALMFAGQALTQMYNNQIGPAKELLGVNEMEAMLLAEKNLPLAEQQIDALDREMERWEGLSEDQQKSEIAVTAATGAAGIGLTTIGQAAVGISAGLDIIKDVTTEGGSIHDAFKGAKEVLGTFGTALSEFDWGTFAQNCKDKLTGIPSWFTGLGWKTQFALIGGIIAGALLGWLAGNWLLDQITKAWGSAIAKGIVIAIGAVMIAAGAAIAIAAGWTGIGLVAAGALAAAGGAMIAAAALYQPGTNAGGAMAEGGIVTQPTIALIGEAGPEAVVPLSNLGAGGTSGGITMNVYTTSSLDPNQVAALSRELAVRFGDEVRRLGTQRVTY